MPDVPCSNPDCSRTAFVSPRQLREKPNGPFPCSECYQPANPTTGWMLKEYTKRGLDEGEKRAFLAKLSSGGKKGESTKLDKWLQKKLGITPPKKDEKKPVDDR